MGWFLSHPWVDEERCIGGHCWRIVGMELAFFSMFYPAKAGGACVCGLQAGLYHSVCTLRMDVGCSCSFL